MTVSAATNTATSAFAWLDHDEQASERLREVLRAFEEKSTLDNLGLGLIRDAFSDQLFPGTSTIQTRARYFLFVPWVFRQLEAEQVEPADFERRLRLREVDLIEALRTGVGSDGQGVIGYNSRERTRRLPSTVYWRGVARLGIRLNDFSMSEYRSRLRDLYRHWRASQRDDDGQPLYSRLQNWNPSLPAPPTRFPREPLTFEMTREEADYLADQIRINASGSFLATLVDDPGMLLDANTPWLVNLGALGEGQRSLVTHAWHFSTVMWGAQLVYNLLLVERSSHWLDRGYGELESDVRGRLRQWVDQIERHRPNLEHWASNIQAFWDAVGRPIPQPAMMFVEQWIAGALADPAAADSQETFRRAIEHREHQLKGGLARITNRSALESWRGQGLGLDPLVYRWPQVTRILNDIHAARV